MAIDTREKRKSAASMLTGILPVAIENNSSKDASWRASSGWGYSGLFEIIIDSGFPTWLRRRRR